MKLSASNDSQSNSTIQSTGMKTMKLMVAICMLMLGQSAWASFVYWGSGADCDYDASSYTLQEVIDLETSDLNNTVQIRLTKQQVVNEDLVILHDVVTIEGGYADCNTYSTSDKTTIQGSGNGPVIQIIPTADDLPNNISLSGLLIKGGSGMEAELGGGLGMEAPDSKVMRVFIRDSLITQNLSKRGGGIYLKGRGSVLNLTNTMLINNEAYGASPGSGLGGGIYCNGGVVYLTGNTGVSQNRATGAANNTGHGGGIYAALGCSVYLSAAADGSLLDFKGVAFNAARGHGGGLYVSNAKVAMSSYWSGRPVNINGNSADSNGDGSGDGGGLYLSGPAASAELRGSLIEDNTASRGAGVAIMSGALLDAGLGDGFCWDQNRCNQILANKTYGTDGLGGAMFMDGGLLILRHSHIAYNQAHSGAAIYAQDNASLVLQRSQVYRNGDTTGHTWDSEHTFRLTDSFLQALHITTAMNDTLGATFSMLNTDRTINNSIIYEPLTNHVANIIGGDGSHDCNLLDNNFGWQGGSNTLIDDPGFVSLGDDDFHLRIDSVAVDACAVGTPDSHGDTEVDMDGEAAPVDQPAVINGMGIYDIGADEFHHSDVIFAHSFD